MKRGLECGLEPGCPLEALELHRGFIIFTCLKVRVDEIFDCVGKLIPDILAMIAGKMVMMPPL